MESLLIYFKKWNIPFHKFFLRHMLIPLVNFGLNQRVVLFLVFLYSGLFHEAFISFPSRMSNVWSFLVITAIPIPSSILVEKLSTKYKCILNWTIFILIWPLMYLLYYSSSIRSNNKVNQQVLNYFDF